MGVSKPTRLGKTTSRAGAIAGSPKTGDAGIDLTESHSAAHRAKQTSNEPAGIAGFEKENRQDGFISRILSSTAAEVDHLSMRPTRNSHSRSCIEAGRLSFPIWSCSGRGLPCGRTYVTPRWSLTPPFHPYPGIAEAVCFLWHFPSRGLSHPAFPRFPGTPCPSESGLSSPFPKKRSDRSPILSIQKKTVSSKL